MPAVAGGGDRAGGWAGMRAHTHTLNAAAAHARTKKKDCCDGSDEARGCANSCIEENAEKRETLAGKVATYKHALETRAGYVAEAKAKAAAMSERFGGIDAAIADADAKLASVAADKAATEALEKEKAAALAAQGKSADPVEPPHVEAEAEGAEDGAAAEEGGEGEEEEGHHNEEEDPAMYAADDEEREVSCVVWRARGASLEGLSDVVAAVCRRPRSNIKRPTTQNNKTPRARRPRSAAAASPRSGRPTLMLPGAWRCVTRCCRGFCCSGRRWRSGWWRRRASGWPGRGGVKGFSLCTPTPRRPLSFFICFFCRRNAAAACPGGHAIFERHSPQKQQLLSSTPPSPA